MALRIPAALRSKASPSLIMRVCVTVSVLVHLVLLLTFQDAFPLYTTPEDLPTYEVELIRPPVEDLDRQEKADGDIQKARAESKPAPEETQDTISLDTDDKRYVTYARAIKEQIMARWSYPRQARDQLLEGRLLVVFSLNNQGSLTGLAVKDSSGHEILDQEATRAVRSAAPFPPFPEHITVSRLNVQASFDYFITSKRAKKKAEDTRNMNEGANHESTK